MGGVGASMGQTNFSAFVLTGTMMLSRKAKETSRFFSFFYKHGSKSRIAVIRDLISIYN